MFSITKAASVRFRNSSRHPGVPFTGQRLSMGVPLPAPPACCADRRLELHREPYVYVNSTAMTSAVTRPFGVLLSAFKGGLWWQRCLVPVLQVVRFAPVSHICLWLSPLTGNERFILSGLNYIVSPDCWCYFTLNNTTQSSRGPKVRA